MRMNNKNQRKVNGVQMMRVIKKNPNNKFNK